MTVMSGPILLGLHVRHDPRMFYHEAFDPVQLMIREAAIPRQADGIKPKRSFLLIAAHVDMDRFVTVTCAKEEPIRAEPQDGGHGNIGCGWRAAERQRILLGSRVAAGTICNRDLYRRWGAAQAEPRSYVRTLC